jgi:hypothetical protein
MAESKKYKIKWDWWEAVVEIEQNEKTLGNIKDQLSFFMGGQRTIDNAENNEEIIEAYLRQIARPLVIESMDWNIKGVIDKIADDMYEGFLPIDGSFGVKLLRIDSWEFSEEDFDIEEA